MVSSLKSCARCVGLNSGDHLRWCCFFYLLLPMFEPKISGTRLYRIDHGSTAQKSFLAIQTAAKSVLISCLINTSYLAMRTSEETCTQFNLCFLLEVL